MVKILLIIISSLINSTICSTQVIFWLTSKLENIEWRKGCLTTAGCAQPRFQLALLNAITNEKLTKSWLIIPKLMQERQRFYVTHWSDGSPNDIQISCEVVGVDPTYGFPRICDSSTPLDIYQNEEEKNLEKRSGIISSFDNDDKIIVRLTARCFNSTIILEKHEERCPWCIEYSDDTVINQQYPEDSKSDFVQFVGNENQLYILLLIFALITAMSSALFAFILYLYVRQKKTKTSSTRKCQPCGRTGATHIVQIESSNNSTENTKYDVPWDHKYRPLPKWASSRSNSSSASPPDTSSTFTTSSQHSKPTKVIIGNILHQKISPNSSIYEKPENSDL